MRNIELTIDTFAELWRQSQPGERSEDEIVRRLLSLGTDNTNQAELIKPQEEVFEFDCLPPSKKWTELLIWTLLQLDGQARLEDIYEVSRKGRKALGHSITRNHDASARECLESHCRNSDKWRGKRDLFCMPHGKGAGVWALQK